MRDNGSSSWLLFHPRDSCFVAAHGHQILGVPMTWQSDGQDLMRGCVRIPSEPLATANHEAITRLPVACGLRRDPGRAAAPASRPFCLSGTPPSAADNYSTPEARRNRPSQCMRERSRDPCRQLAESIRSLCRIRLRSTCSNDDDLSDKAGKPRHRPFGVWLAVFFLLRVSFNRNFSDISLEISS